MSVYALTFILCVRQPRVSVLWFRWWRGISISGLTLHYLQTTFRLKYTHTHIYTEQLLTKIAYSSKGILQSHSYLRSFHVYVNKFQIQTPLKHGKKKSMQALT